MKQEKYEKLKRKARESKQRAYKKHLEKQKGSDWYKKKESLNELRFSNKSGSHINCFRGSVGAESPEHLDTKYKVWKKLREWEHDIIVEAIFKNGKRADIIDLSEAIIYEITHSETEEELKEKTKSYPEVFEIRRIDANKEFEEDDLL